MAKQEAEDLIQSYVAQYYSKQSSLGPISYAGYVFNTAKPGRTPIAITSFTSSIAGWSPHVEQEFHETMVYYPVRFENLLSSSGTLDFTMDDSIAGSSPLLRKPGNSNYTDGYANPWLPTPNLSPLARTIITVPLGMALKNTPLTRQLPASLILRTVIYRIWTILPWIPSPPTLLTAIPTPLTRLNCHWSANICSSRNHKETISETTID